MGLYFLRSTKEQSTTTGQWTGKQSCLLLVSLDGYFPFQNEMDHLVQMDGCETIKVPRKRVRHIEFRLFASKFISSNFLVIDMPTFLFVCFLFKRICLRQDH